MVADENIRITKNKEVKVSTGTLCNSCDNITRFSDEDDDFVPNYDITYEIEFKRNCIEITLCESCLRKLKSKIDDILDK